MEWSVSTCQCIAQELKCQDKSSGGGRSVSLELLSRNQAALAVRESSLAGAHRRIYKEKAFHSCAAVRDGQDRAQGGLHTSGLAVRR